MTMKKGIDVSDNNGKLDWYSLKNKIKFAILRAGFGTNTVDLRLDENANACKKYNIPFGLYWFSYALNVQQSIDEANKLCDYADKYNPSLPLAYDFEYDSDRYAKSCGVSLSNSDREKMAIAFLNQIKKRGYSAMIYTNPDYIENKGFKNVIKQFPLWLAEWGSKADYNYVIWQYGQENLDGSVDVNYSDLTFDKDYSQNLVNIFNTEQYSFYLGVAADVIKGKYGSGQNRVNAIRAKGYDFEIVQTIVNELLSKAFIKTIDEYISTYQYDVYLNKAKDYKNGRYGNDSEAKKYLNSIGYDFEMVRSLSKQL